MNWPQGVLWGNASGPTISSVLSSVLLEILHKQGFGVEFCSTISKLPRGRFLQRVVQQWGDSMEVIEEIKNICIVLNLSGKEANG